MNKRAIIYKLMPFLADLFLLSIIMEHLQIILYLKIKSNLQRSHKKIFNFLHMNSIILVIKIKYFNFILI